MKSMCQDLSRQHTLQAYRLAAPRPAEQEQASAQAQAPTSTPSTRWTVPTWRQWRLFILQVCLVVGIEVSDDTLRGLVFPRAPGPTEVNALHLVQFEQTHGFWLEPAFQRFFEQTHDVLGFVITWSQIVPLANAIYGVAHGLVTLIVAIWLFWRRPNLFPLVRNVFVFSTAMSVVLYNLFPVAPPRLVDGLRYAGRPFHFVDTIFEGGGVKLSFDQYAAMPSLHVVWALIVGIALVVAGERLILKLIGIVYPILMSATVIITGNHYIADCLGAAAVVGLAYLLALLVAHWRDDTSSSRVAPAA